MIIIPESIISKLNLQQRVIAEEIMKRGVQISKIRNTNIFIFAYKSHREFFIGSYTGLIPYHIGLIISNKNYTRQILKQNKIPIAEGKLFTPFEESEAFIYSRTIKFPVLLRQENAQNSIQSIKVEKEENFKNAFKKLSETSENILVEKYFPGESYRVCYATNGYINLLKRKEDNDYEDYTTGLNQGILKLSRSVISVFSGVKFVSFDVRIRNIVHSIKTGNYLVTEVYPSFGKNILYEMTKRNKRRKAVEVIADLLFPETVK